MDENKSSSNGDGGRIAFKPIAICLDNFRFRHGPDKSRGDELFVGRRRILERLSMLLEESNRGSFLVAGYRGSGKTSIVNLAILEYESKKKNPKPLVIHLNLGHGDRLKPEPIFYSIAAILQNELISQHKSQKYLKPFIGALIILCLLWLIAHYLFNPISFLVQSTGHELDSESVINRLLFFCENIIHPYLDYSVLLTLLIIIAYGVYRWFGGRVERRLASLLMRMQNVVTDQRGVLLKSSGFHIGGTRRMTSHPVSYREIEQELFNIFEMLSNRRIIIVFDELDKLSGRDARYISHHFPANDRASITSQRQELINELLGSLKNFITTAKATFIFIAGQETLDNYYSERGSANSLYESLFDHIIKVPSLLTDEFVQEEEEASKEKKANNVFFDGRPSMTALIEQYVCARLYKGNNGSFYTLQEYHHILKDHENKSDVILILRNFINYLAFHSWGNPKRLSAIFESYVKFCDSSHFRNEYVIIVGGDEEKKKNEKAFYLFFNYDQLHSLALTSNIFTLFQNRLGREVSRIGDKLTISSLASLQFILKLHSYGFTRETLYRMSEALNIYRSPELNIIVDDLLRYVFKPYIRRIRNGIYRYRFNSDFEKETRYITYFSDFESASYNFSVNAMDSVKRYIQLSFHIDGDELQYDVISQARAHLSLGEINAMERSFAQSAVHFSMAIRLLEDKMHQKAGWHNCDWEISVLYLEALLKYGDLEEHRQNYGYAAAIFSKADEYASNALQHDRRKSRSSFQSGDSKWEIFNLPHWAKRFLSLKRSLPHEATVYDELEFMNPRYKTDDPRYYYRSACFGFFLLGYSSPEKSEQDGFPSDLGNQVLRNYDEAIRLSCAMTSDFAKANERRDYLVYSSIVGMVETKLIQCSASLCSHVHDDVKALKDLGYSKVFEWDVIIQNNMHKWAKEMISCLKHDGAEDTFYYSNFGKSDIIGSLKCAARGFENSGLYISAVIVYFKLISYLICCLDFPRIKGKGIIFDKEMPLGVKRSEMSYFFRQIRDAATNAMKCIELDRGVPSSQISRSLKIYDFSEAKSEEKPRVEMDNKKISRLFSFLNLEDCGSENWPIKEQAFWQSSTWGQKLAALLYWAEYVRNCYDVESKIMNVRFPDLELEYYGVFEPSKNPVLSVRSRISMRWVYSRSLIEEIKQYVDNLSAPGCQRLEENDDFDALNELGHIKKQCYMAARNLYYALLDISLISRKNLDLVFPSLWQIYLWQWELIYRIVYFVLKKSEGNVGSVGDVLDHVRNWFIDLDAEFGGLERLDPSHFDYDFILAQLKGHLRNSFNMPDCTSRTRTNVLQQKYFIHDDHSDPEFRMDWTVEMLLAPLAGHLHSYVEARHEQLMQMKW